MMNGLSHELKRSTLRTALFLSLSLVLVGLYGCEPFTPQEKEALEKAPTHVTVLAVDNPLSYQRDSHGQVWGIDAELLNLWATHYKIGIKFKTYHTQEDVLDAFERGEGDIAAARLPTLSHNDDVLSGPTIDESHLSLYCLKKAKIENVRDLAGKRISVLEKDLSSELKYKLEKQNLGLRFNIFHRTTTRELLVTLPKQQADCAIVDSVEGALSSQTYLMIEKIVALTEDQPISWWVHANQSEVVTLMQIWFQKASRKNEIVSVTDRYLLKSPELDESDIRFFYRSIQSTLPTYKKIFKEAAYRYQIPWQMIAAVAYQESHWNPEARSYTGVRGLMQITQETALRLGLNDRNDPKQSVFGGSQYLHYLFGLSPKNIDRKERWALALASYNIGLAHIKDAQKLAVSKGLNPYSWHDLKKVIPMLADESIASELDYGSARGFETVEYVDRTFAFYKLLALRD